MLLTASSQCQAKEFDTSTFDFQNYRTKKYNKILLVSMFCVHCIQVYQYLSLFLIFNNNLKIDILFDVTNYTIIRRVRQIFLNLTHTSHLCDTPILHNNISWFLPNGDRTCGCAVTPCTAVPSAVI